MQGAGILAPFFYADYESDTMSDSFDMNLKVEVSV
jgi:hypothetical protein